MDIVRSAVRAISGYVPGEQPQGPGWIKLNTNENPYPPSPRVREAVNAALERLEVYPDPRATAFRDAAAAAYGVDPDWILPANGSDENLTVLLRTFVDEGDTVSYPYPGYVLYETLAQIQGAAVEPLVLHEDGGFSPAAQELAKRSKLVLVPNPNSPTGTWWSRSELEAFMPDRGVFVLDCAYADFAQESLSSENICSDLKRPVVITRTLSKSYSLAGLRLGFAIAHPDVIRQMTKVKDSYNCDALSIAAGAAAIQDQEWMLGNRQRIHATRARTALGLESLGFQVQPSQANFLWTTHSTGEHERIYRELKDRRILIRYMQFPKVPWKDNYDGLRISIGTDAQVDALLDAISQCL